MFLLPYADDNKVRHFPIVNMLLMIINVAVFLYEMQLAQAGRLEPALMQWAVVPRDLVHHLGQEQLLDLLRTMFLHGGWLHLLSNMLFLYIFGDNVEDRLGPIRYLLLFLASGVAASLAQVFLTPASGAPLIGASGAIAGVLGAYGILYPNTSVRTLFWFIFILTTIRIPAILLLGGWFILQFVRVYYESHGAMAGDGVAYAAHVGGFIAGVVLILFLTPSRNIRPAYS